MNILNTLMLLFCGCPSRTHCKLIINGRAGRHVHATKAEMKEEVMRRVNELGADGLVYAAMLIESHFDQSCRVSIEDFNLLGQTFRVHHDTKHIMLVPEMPVEPLNPRMVAVMRAAASSFSCR